MKFYKSQHLKKDPFTCCVLDRHHLHVSLHLVYLMMVSYRIMQHAHNTSDDIYIYIYIYTHFINFIYIYIYIYIYI